ncbi:hypothetical protein [Cellulomonas sp. KH9]|uniref:hypothetical protein n=1 Tax=Cellulomonas sp. KH9 TaxID=1855324 RepID=UPI0008EEE41C|nr:hypothetical protein [Cellulomonas sp. KH9]SFK01361.1 hypothetical protein SAMN05216467_1701 [Cellulomonas sp. KH9]
MPLPEHLTTAHLRVAVVPDLVPTDPAEHRAAVRAVLETTRARLDLRADLLDGWRERAPLLPLPTRTTSLQQAVQAARVRLRADRAAAERTEVDNRRYVLTTALEALR